MRSSARVVGLAIRTNCGTSTQHLARADAGGSGVFCKVDMFAGRRHSLRVGRQRRRSALRWTVRVITHKVSESGFGLSESVHGSAQFVVCVQSYKKESSQPLSRFHLSGANSFPSVMHQALRPDWALALGPKCRYNV
jgi:hypothetical protein